MASVQNTYILTEDDLSYWETEDPPEVRAAQNPDPRVLHALLNQPATSSGRKYSAQATVPAHIQRRFATPLTAAIKSQLPKNVHTLLQHGALPDGYPVDVLSQYASIFLRFRDQCRSLPTSREEVLTRISTPQTAPITAFELEQRCKTACPFWKGADSVPLDFYTGGEGMTALEEACKHNSTEILDLIIASAPDISFWTARQTEVQGADTPSSLSVSNPLICAIKYGQNHHLRRLLEIGFDPNSMPLVCRQQCYSPLMATLICCEPPNWDAFSLLLAHPATSRDLLTPVTKVHLLHLAVATLSLSTLQQVLQNSFDLSTVLPTAVGHTLLHIACLPLDITHVNIFQESIYNSAHEFRQLSSGTRPAYIIFDGDMPRPQPIDWFAAQMEMVLYLLAQSPDPNALIAAQDWHGNTAFHYLAMHRTVNHEILDALIEFSDQAENVYYEVRNRWDWTAETLVRHGEVSEADVSKNYWRVPHAAKIVEGAAVVLY